MNLIELLVLLAFVFFPLLQALLERVGKSGRDAQLPPSPQEEEEELEAADARVAQRPARANVPAPPAPAEPRTARRQEDWSSGWGSWPAEEGAATDAIDTWEELSAEEVVTEDQADELIAYQERLAARDMPEAARVTVPVVSMEPLRVDRTAEHRRLHERLSPVESHARPRTRRSDALGSALRTPADLRRAVLLSEILGPPRAMQ